MARFRGEMWGTGKSSSSRQGSKNTGLSAEIGSWSGGVRVRLYADGQDRDCCEVGFMKSVLGAGKNVVLYDGPVDDPTEVDKILQELHEKRMLDFADVAPKRGRKVTRLKEEST
jgi:hypothetical protein